MVGRARGAPAPAVGRRESQRKRLGGERPAEARAPEMLEQQLARANEELTSLRAEIERLKQSNIESSTRLWAKVEGERLRTTAAAAAEAKAVRALERRTRETIAHKEAALALATRLEAARIRLAAAATAQAKALMAVERWTKEAAAKDGALQASQAKVLAARHRASDRQAQLEYEAARSGAFEADASALRQAVEELSAQLAEATAERIQAAAEKAIANIAEDGGPMSDKAVRRIVNYLLPRRWRGAPPSGVFQDRKCPATTWRRRGGCSRLSQGWPADHGIPCSARA